MRSKIQRIYLEELLFSHFSFHYLDLVKELIVLTFYKFLQFIALLFQVLKLRKEYLKFVIFVHKMNELKNILRKAF
jgi:hypothetical protein